MTTARSTLSHEAISVTFEDVKKLIYKTCHDFIQVHGGNYEDTFSKSQEVFLTAYENFNPTRGASFPTYLRQVIWWRLTDDFRLAQFRLKSLPRSKSSTVETTVEKKTTGFDLEDFCEGANLSEDAKIVCGLVVNRLDVPGSMRAGKAALRKILIDEFNWNRPRYEKAFQQITTVLKANQRETKPTKIKIGSC